MTVSKLLEQDVIKIGKNPVVVLPLKIWQEIENKLEELEMAESKTLRKKIAKARAEQKLYSSTETKKLLRI